MGLADSKRLPPQRRAEIYEQLQSLDVHGSICAHTVIQAVETIDTLGIREANRRAMHEILLALTPTDERVTVRIDGADNFYFPGYPCGYTWAKKA